MRSLFADDKLSFLRQPMGASDFVDGPHYTYDDVPAGETDYRLGTSRSPTTASRSCRCCAARCAQPEAQGDRHAVEPAGVDEDQPVADRRPADRLAAHLRRLRALLRQVRARLQARGRADLRADAPERAAEPQAQRLPGHGHAGPPGGEADRGARAEAPPRGPAHEAPRLRPQLEDAPNDVADTPPGEDPETEYPTDLLQTPAGRWLDGTAFHCYAGDPSRQTELQHASRTRASGSPSAPARTARPIRRRRCSPTRSSGTRATSCSASPATGRKTVVNWNLALDPNGGPHNGGCDTCTGVLTVGPGDTCSQNAEYFTLGHLARFVRPGRGADRQHLVRDHRLERADHGRRVPQPRRLDRARRPQRERRPADVRRRAGRLVVRLHAARRRARDVRVEGAARRRLPAARPAASVRTRRSTTTPPRPGRGTRSTSTSAAPSACAASWSTPAPTRLPPRPATRFPRARRRALARDRHGTAPASSPRSISRRRRRGTCASP